MNLLALETSSALFSVALKTKEACLTYQAFMTHQQSQVVLPVIQQLLNDANLSLQNLDAIALGAGPGSFTGLRVGSSVAQALAFAYDLPVILISSLKVCAQTVFNDLKHPRILTAFNAYQQEVYWAAYEANSQGYMQAVISDSLAKPAQVILPSNGNWLGVGDAWDVYERELRAHCSSVISDVQTNRYPLAKTVVELAETEFTNKNFVSAKDAIPIYLRGGDAWKKIA